MKLLLFRPSPRDNILTVNRWNDKLPCDKLFVKFYTEDAAYKIARDFFLQHTEYDYFVIAPDDMVVYPKNIKQLQKDLAKKEYPVFTGICNVSQKDKEHLTIAFEFEAENSMFKEVKWLLKSELPEENIFKVGVAGFPLMAIRRDVMEKFDFNDKLIFNGGKSENGGSIDVLFCWKCKTHDIPIYSDKRISMLHYRDSGRIRVGNKKAETVFEAYP